MSEDAATAMIELLAREREAIRVADYHVLDALAATKADTFAVLMRGGTDPATLERIQKGLAVNQTLLAAAISGVKAAQARLRDMQNVRQELTVYDRAGQMAPVRTARPGLEKKA